MYLMKDKLIIQRKGKHTERYGRKTVGPSSYEMVARYRIEYFFFN